MEKAQPPMTAVFVFGPVGVGKTTIAQALAAHVPGAALVPEPVTDNPFLPLYALDQARWALACQTRYYLDYVRAYVSVADAQPPRVIIDAGAPTNAHVYARYMREQGIVTPDEYELYEMLTRIIHDRFAYPEPALIISVEASLATCAARLHTRGRAFELAGHTPAYLAAIHAHTQAMVAAYAAAGVPVLHYDAERWDARREDGIAALVQAVLRAI
jgi:deoxyadenosine/deoxycytidine kinase